MTQCSIARKKNLFATIITLYLVMIVVPTIPATAAPLQTVAYVDLTRYSGTWYEIASFPNGFNQDCFNSKATYHLNKKGVLRVKNSCNIGSSRGEEESTQGIVKVVDPVTNAKLKVRLFPPEEDDYWIIELGAAYEYSVASDPERKTLWILSRTKTLDQVLLDGLIERLQTIHGFDTSQLRYTPQE